MGLDVSTTTAGWAIFDNLEARPIMGFISLGKEESLYEKADKFKIEIDKILKKYNVDEVFLEEDLQRFSKGKSSSAVLQKLSRFNGMASFIVFQLLGKPPVHINVNVARRLVGCKIDKTDKTLSVKEKVLQWSETAPFVSDYPWPTKVILSGKRKGEIVKIKEVGDMLDAYIVAHAGHLQLVK